MRAPNRITTLLAITAAALFGTVTKAQPAAGLVNQAAGSLLGFEAAGDRSTTASTPPTVASATTAAT